MIVVGATINPLRSGQAGNTLLTQHVTPDQLTVSTFSNINPDVLAVGEFIGGHNGEDGTSFSAPQVAGLASYLWMLSPDLKNFQPISATKNAIVANTRDNFIDAYASALSLDGNITPQTAPMRLALLDLNGDGKFNEADVNQFLRHFYVVDGDPNTGTISHIAVPDTTSDFSRYDLNGDGFTTAADRRERFDLDRVGSVQFGATNYSNDVHRNHRRSGRPVRRNLAHRYPDPLLLRVLTDLYRRQRARKNLMEGRCGFTIPPATATLSLAQHQQFTVNYPTRPSRRGRSPAPATPSQRPGWSLLGLLPALSP